MRTLGSRGRDHRPRTTGAPVPARRQDAAIAVTIHLPEDASDGIRPTLSPLAELSAALHVLTSPDHHLFLTEWRDRILATFPPGLSREFQALEFLWDGYRANYFLAVPGDLPVHRELDDELAALAAIPTDAFATESLQPLGTRPDEPLAPGHRPGQGDDQLLAHARARGSTVEATARALLDDPERVQARLVAFLAGCREAFFDAEWRGLEPVLRQSVDDATTILASRGPLALLEGLSHGIHRRDDRSVVVDKAFEATIDLTDQPCLLVLPSLLCHPHVIVQSNPRWVHGIQYPVHRRAPTEALPPLEVTVARLEALADPSRRELAALLANEARSTQELAGLAGLTPPTVSRHLTVLREAGLVHVTQQGHFRLHHLDLDAIGGLGHALRASLLR